MGMPWERYATSATEEWERKLRAREIAERLANTANELPCDELVLGDLSATELAEVALVLLDMLPPRSA